ncbi:MAG: hypothetical protein COU42_01240 [Candidatus Nealsonbacteria bacterium CG10_big_fil_rev_8_21_14_0_10_36_24]|uniref:Uncharacterized protein n=2 Tax=Candidatus Nealsoniibacteriota TaxID=1817911 RepID=A0A2H0YPI6_9BACT|nr:MAG: hypothetical protein COU42_01240 [Candidatus Nealsonbacteria bacterium CG10_big_fil_rev_8_21_14_0_10_36_24]PIS40336.1 MAG: hypothetical protein COT32_00290 [Candidatus Nealsonbacteria bacterium CG08_land_8_20_14_0_20_36_22]
MAKGKRQTKFTLEKAAAEKKDTYYLHAQCTNCGRDMPRMKIPKGQGLTDKKCPTCGNATLREIHDPKL